MKTLKEIAELEQSSFGQPRPRHGLKLLYWFATECLAFDQNNVMWSCIFPEKGDYGFHTFDNKYERHSGKLLPILPFTYYEVGNLSKHRSYNLPLYVREDYTGLSDESNMDRIIVSLNNECFEKAYVTQHRDQSNFNKAATFCISKHLIMIIRNMTLQEFLLKTGYLKQKTFPICLVELSNLRATSPAPSTSAICSPLQDKSTNKDVHENEPALILMENNTQGHHIAPSTKPICISALTISKKQDLRIEFETSTIFIKQDAEEHHDTPPLTSTCTHATPIQDHCTDIEPPSNLIKNNTHGRQESSPPILTPTTTSSPSQDIYTEIDSLPVSTNNNTHISGQSELNSVVQDTAFNYFRNCNLQTTSKDIQTSSTRTPTNMPSKSQNPNIESSPISHMNWFFWGVYLLFLFFHFSFFWGNIMRMTVISVSSKFLWQKWKRGAQDKKEKGGKRDNAQVGKTTNSSEEKRKENDNKMHVVTTCTQTVMSPWKPNTDIDSFPVPQINSSFCAFYLLWLFCFFYFFWGNVTRVLIFVVLLYHYHSIRKHARQRNKLDIIHTVTNYM